MAGKDTGDIVAAVYSADETELNKEKKGQPDPEVENFRKMLSESAEGRDERKKHRKKRRGRMSPLLKILIVLCIGIVCWQGLSIEYFDVTKIEVEGNSYYSEDEIINMSGLKTGGNIFWGSKLGAAESRLMKDAYMSDVNIKRKLPDTLVIDIEERVQSAAVCYGEKYAVIDGEGTVLRTTGVEPKVTAISGLTIEKLVPGSTIGIKESVSFRRALSLVKACEENNMYFKSIHISESMVKASVYDNLVCTGSVDEIQEAVEDKSLQLTLQSLFDKDITRGTVTVGGDGYISYSPSVD